MLSKMQRTFGQVRDSRLLSDCATLTWFFSGCLEALQDALFLELLRQAVEVEVVKASRFTCNHL